MFDTKPDFAKPRQYQTKMFYDVSDAIDLTEIWLVKNVVME